MKDFDRSVEAISHTQSANTQGKPESPAPSAPPRLPWLEWQKGERVVLRYRLEDGLHDALGDVVEVAPDFVSIETRRGLVRVEARTMVTGKRVPPPPIGFGSAAFGSGGFGAGGFASRT